MPCCRLSNVTDHRQGPLWWSRVLLALVASLLLALALLLVAVQGKQWSCLLSKIWGTAWQGHTC